MKNAGIKQLITPFRIGGLDVRNRVFVPGHTTNFGHANHPTQRHVHYHAERARGGVGLIITEAVRVHPTSAGRHISLGCFDDTSVPAYAAVTEAVHAHGALVFAQLMHAGRQANGDATRTAAWAPMDVPWASGAAIPHAMGPSDIAVVVAAFGEAARRMGEAGFDGVEIHLGHGHLLQQFLSPFTNRRTDRYGGSEENRLRLVREVLDRVRERAPDLPLGIRVSADEFLPGGLGPAEVMAAVGELRAEHPLAYVHVSHSAYHGSSSLATQMADMSFGHAPFRHHAAQFKRAFPDLPVLAVCRLDSLAEAAVLVEEGEADLVGLARPHIADPHLVRKTLDGRAHEIRSCLACNQGCVGRLEASLPISCVVNPEVGAEREWIAVRLAGPAPARRVVVVGGGPAGMQAALSARRAGHEVTLVEAGDHLGGQIVRAGSVPGRERLTLMTDELARDIARAGVTVRTGERVIAADLLPGGRHGGFDEVILATGSLPRRRELPLGPEVFDLWQATDAVSGKNSDVPSALLGTVVIRDDGGDWPAASLTECLAREGAVVHLVTPSAALFPRITTYSRLGLTGRLGALGVKARPLRTVVDAVGDRVTLQDTLNGDTEELHGVTAIVDAGLPTAADDLYRVLDGHPDAPPVLVVGDANAPRTALEAIYEGRMAGTFLSSAASGAATLAAAGGAAVPAH
ncbi:FAD-dependent oxidoreductase [Streptomyces sp. NPDC060366]|uniref:oxidoreductase n=1 Tax=Streptomyces sp. NPDC060366 TaxID=3347105 RepID=UPI0036649833